MSQEINKKKLCEYLKKKLEKKLMKIVSNFPVKREKYFLILQLFLILFYCSFCCHHIKNPLKFIK